MLTVTPLYAGLLGLLYLLLAANVIRTRRTAGVNLGTGGDELLERRIRAHGNFAEYAPLGLIMIGTLELTGAPSHGVLHALGIALTVGRILHGWALSSLTRHPVARVGGMAITLTVIGSAALACLLTVLTG